MRLLFGNCLVALGVIGVSGVALSADLGPWTRSCWFGTATREYSNGKPPRTCNQFGSVSEVKEGENLFFDGICVDEDGGEDISDFVQAFDHMVIVGDQLIVDERAPEGQSNGQISNSTLHFEYNADFEDTDGEVHVRQVDDAHIDESGSLHFYKSFSIDGTNFEFTTATVKSFPCDRILTKK
jgi:hypothetical protein